MWKLKVAHGDGGPYREWLYSTNNFIGRQTWEFNPNAGTPEERAAVDKTRQEYHNNRFHIKPAGDMLLRLQ
ncbi:Terpene cyclase/mutase family member, partial [Thalictrum thalictroides]